MPPINSGLPMRDILRTAFMAALTLILMQGLQSHAQQTPVQCDTIDALSYDLYLTVTDLPSQTISGKAGIRFTTSCQNTGIVKLNLLQLQVDSVKSESGQALSYTHQNDELTVTLQQPVSGGDTAWIHVWYHGIPFHEAWGGFHFSGSYAFNLGVGFESVPHNLGRAWFPCVDNFTDKAFYDYHIRVENDKIAACGGVLRSVSTMCDGTKEYFWRSNRPVPAYLASVAIGPYALKEAIFPGQQAEIPVTWFVRPQDTAKVAGSFANLNAIAAIYEECFGPYPFERIGFSGTALGAMEHAENIAYPHGSINGGLSDEWLCAHELSHMWFGNSVTCVSDADMWLNEGWARWCETLYREKLYNIDEAKTNMRQMSHEVLRMAHLAEGGYLPLSPMPPQLTYGIHTYDKGGMVTHALRGYLGDSLFFNGVKAYLANFAYQSASSQQMRDFLSNYTGTDLNGFFDFHVFGPGFNHVSVDSFNVIPAGDEYLVEVFVKQKLKGATVPAAGCRTILAFMSSERITEYRTITFSGWTGSAAFVLPFNPVLVMADLHEQTGDATTDNYRTIRTPGSYEFPNTWFRMEVAGIADSAFARVTHNWVAPDSMLTPIEGLRLSDYRYWSIEGIFPEGFEATGRFTYNRNNALDNTLITSPADSLVILYRRGAGHEWESVPFTRQGPWQLGVMIVLGIRAGDYTLAIWDEDFVNTHNIAIPGMGILRIRPNPASTEVLIHTEDLPAGNLVVTDSTGRIRDRNRELPEGSAWRLNTSSYAPGTYIVTFNGRNGITRTAKLVIGR